MRKTAARAVYLKHLGKVAGTLFLMAGLTFLIGCQGLSTASSSSQKQTSVFSLLTTTLDFGTVSVGSSKTLTVTATNSGPASVTVSSAGISTKFFSLVAPSLPITVAAGQSITISILFMPNAVGPFSGTLSITSDASNTVTNLPLLGTGIGTAPGQITLTPASEGFGSVTVGSKQSQTVTLSNTGISSVNISQASVSGAAFQLSGITTPLALNASESTTFTITFAPQASGSTNGTLTISSDASNPSMTISLSGTGVAPGVMGSNPTSLNFGGVTVGSKQSLSETVTNTGGSAVTISQVGISGTGFSVTGITAPVTLTAGQSATFSVTFTPASAASVSGSVAITSNASNPTLTISLSGTGVAPGGLGSNPNSLGFGSITLGTKQSLSETVTNNGGSSVTISQVGVSGTGFSLSGITTPVTLTTGQSATFAVAFTPASAGSVTGNVTITSNASNPTLTVPMSGTGISLGALGSNPASLGFGSVTVGGKQSLLETVTNTGGTAVTISQVGTSGTGYSVSGITAPVTLAAGQSATFSVAFTPASTGSVSGNIEISSNASTPTLTIPLSGIGVAPAVLGSNPISLSFGSVTVGNKQSLSETVTNTGGTAVTISQVGTSGPGYSLSGITAPVTLAAGQSATFSVTFTPASAANASGNVTITSNASNPTLTIPLSGTGVAAGTLGSNPTSISFGSVAVGGSQSLSEMVTNSGGSSVAISQVGITGTGYSLSGITTPLTLTAGQSATFTVTFTPASAGSVSGNVAITSNASNPTLTIPLSGTGIAATGQLTLIPTTLSLGSVVVGTSGTASGSLTASGSAVTVTAAGSNNSEFSVGGLPLPLTIPAGQSASFTVTFSPQVSGVASGTLTFTSNAQPATTTETLTGTGTPAPTHTVNLSWNASTSSNISGYNIYRAVYTSSCGSFSKINSVLNTPTLYTDSGVVDGASYCYATTAVDSSNQESGYSNIATNVQIPAP